MVTDAVGLYVHIPFCKSKCNYCDFCSSPATRSEYERYTDRLTEEISAFKRDNKIPISTVFFGGGTPSILPIELLRKIFGAIRESFIILPGAEITLEANPNTLSLDNLIEYRHLGINRITMGMQSIHENELKILGRTHSYRDAKRAVAMIKEAGFVNFNIDLMYGIPGQTVASFEETLEAAISMSPTHISAYGLILEEGTPLYLMRDTLDFPSEDEECDMYELAVSKLARSGYLHYEISNYAKDGFYSFHNLNYWYDGVYIGVGLSAHSYFGGRRYFSPSVMSEYLKGKCVEYISEDESPDRRFEYVMMRMRLSEGISLSEYESLFGESFLSGREAKLASFENMGYLTVKDGRVAFTDKGMYVSNTLLSELI